MGKEKGNERPVKQTYVVFETGEVLEDPLLIDYYKLHQYDLLLQNKLLGNFTEEGKYELDQDLKLSLVKLKKLLIEVRPGVFFAESEIKHTTMHFRMKYWREEETAYSSLYLVEKIGDKEIVSFVAQYSAEYSDSFIDKSKAVFNILNSIEEWSDEYSQFVDELYEELVRKEEERAFVVELQSEIFIEQIIVLLKSSGKFEEILKALEQQREFELTQPDKTHLFTRLRNFLDDLIITQIGLNEFKKILPDVEKPVQVFVKPVKEYDQISKKLDQLSEKKTLPAKVISAKKAAKASKGAKAKAIKPYKGEKPAKAKKPGKDKQIVIAKKDAEAFVAPAEPAPSPTKIVPAAPVVQPLPREVEQRRPAPPPKTNEAEEANDIDALLDRDYNVGGDVEADLIAQNHSENDDYNIGKQIEEHTSADITNVDYSGNLTFNEAEAASDYNAKKPGQAEYNSPPAMG